MATNLTTTNGNSIGRGGPPPAPDLPQVGEATVTGIILAGVHSWGDGVLENVACRPLLPVATRPLIRHVVDWLAQGGIREAYVCANSHTRILRGSLGHGDGTDISLKYYEDHMPRGPAGCARDAGLISSGQVFVVVEGTIVPRIAMADLLDAHARSKADLTVAVADAGSRQGGADATLSPAGIYVLNRSLLEHVSPTGYQDIKEALIPRLRDLGKRVAAYVVSADLVPRVSGAASYLAVNHWAVQRVPEQAAIQYGHERRDDAWVHTSADVHPAARLVGNVLIGPDCVIETGALIVGPTTVGAGTRVCSQAVISRSAVWERCTVESGAVVDQCILTDGSTVESDVVVRSTVFVPRQRWGRRLIERMAAYCGMTREGTRIIRANGRHTHDIPSAPTVQPEEAPAAASLRRPETKEAFLTPTMETERR